MVETVLHVESVVHEIWPDLPITLDLLDVRDGDYHNGLNFAILRKAFKAKLPEAVPIKQGLVRMPQGLSIYMERVLRALPGQSKARLSMLAASAGLATAMALVERGRHVVMGSEGADAKQEAQKMGCRLSSIQLMICRNP